MEGRPAVARYLVITWDVDGRRLERDADTLDEAMAAAKRARTVQNRTVKIGLGGDSICHWSRTLTARRNHWARHSTAECAR